MKTFKINVVNYLVQTVEVKANSEEEALKLARKVPIVITLKNYSHTGFFPENAEHY